MNLSLERLPQVSERSGRAPSTVRDDIRKKLFTQPVKLGPRASGWPAHETDQIIAARIAGQTNDQIRDLVEKLHAARGRTCDLLEFSTGVNDPITSSSAAN